MRRLIATLALTAALASGAAAQAQTSAKTGTLDGGIWRNPKNTVHLQIKPCGPEVSCGDVVWASKKALDDARQAGNKNLIGMRILREFRPAKDGSWRGKVFVPDLNATFQGSATFIDVNNMRAKGCLIGGFLCKSQVWTRVEG